MTILEYNPETDYVLFCDTGREHKKTYKFVLDFEAHEGIPVIKIGYQPRGFEYVKELGQKDYFALYLEQRDFEEIPNMMKRSCTIELKVKTARRWARKNIGMAYVNMLGFRSDEPQRVRRNKRRWQQVIQQFPLHSRGVNKAIVQEYWGKKPYSLEIPHILGNCTLCFMKGRDNIINILKHHPELAEPWMEDERRSKENHGHTYLNGISIKNCLQIAQQPDLFTPVDLELLSPADLFTPVDLELLNPAFDCSCTA